MGTKVYDNYADLITFNRNSKGTALRPISYGDELVVNGTFDTDTDWVKYSGWTISGGVANANIASGFNNINQALPLTERKLYRLEFDVTSYTSGGVSAYLGNSGNAGAIFYLSGPFVSSLTTAAGVGTYTGYRVCPVGQPKQILLRAQNGFVGTIDNVSIKEVIFDRDGDPLTLFTHPAGVPRIEYDADRNIKGLLIEPQSVNICKQSEDFTTMWSPSNATITANDTTAPDGNTTADKIEITATGGIINQVFTSSATTYTFSVWLKEGNTTVTDIATVDSGTLSYRIRLTWATGALSVISGTPTATKINELSNGWFRISVTATLPAGGTDIIGINPAGDGLGTSGDYVYVWGAQLEESPIATSYIKTLAEPSGVTRGKDEASMTNVSGLIGQKEGTLYVEVDWRDASGFRYLLTASDNSVFNFVTLLTGNTNQVRGIARVKNVELASIEETGATNTGVTKIAFAYKTNDFELYKNGSSLGTDTTGSVAFSSVVDQINLGAYYNYTLQANMHIRAIQIIPRRLSDEQLIELTS
jgi:hypothetical protein